MYPKVILCSFLQVQLHSDDLVWSPYIDGFVQDWSTSIATGLEILQSCTKPSTIHENCTCRVRNVCQLVVISPLLCVPLQQGNISTMYVLCLFCRDYTSSFPCGPCDIFKYILQVCLRNTYFENHKTVSVPSKLPVMSITSHNETQQSSSYMHNFRCT